MRHPTTHPPHRPRSATLRDWLKLGLSAIVEHTGAGTVVRAVRTFASGARIHVLGYHRVVDHIDFDSPINPSLCITTATFQRQMEQLRERFVILPLSYVTRAVRGELEVPQDAAAVTFDDGYRDVLVRAAPVLRALDIPAAVFVPTGFERSGVDGAPRDPGSARLLPHDRLYAGLWAARRGGVPLPSLGGTDTALLLSRAQHLLHRDGPAAAVEELIRITPAATMLELIEALESHFGRALLDEGAEVLAPDEVRQLADAGWEIGAHTEGHVVLTHEPIEEVRRQLAESKAALERWTGRPCRFFAYCNGYHSPQLVEELVRAGYEGAVTTCDRPNTVSDGDPFRINRKVLWEAHARGPGGRFSPALSAAQLHDLFGTLGLTSPVDGEIASVEPASRVPAPLPPPPSDGKFVQSHNSGEPLASQIVRAHNTPQSPRVRTHDDPPDDDDGPNDLEPTEVELAY